MAGLRRVMAQLPETRESLWMLIASPAIWALHFLLCYLTAAVLCAKFADAGSTLTTIRYAVALYTLLALAGIAVTTAVGYRQHRLGRASVPHDYATDADRHRFLGFATLLLSGLSAVAVLYVALAALFPGGCR
jgi:hypothetical protein